MTGINNKFDGNALNSMRMMQNLFKVEKLTKKKKNVLEQSLGVFFRATGGNVDRRHLSGLSEGLMKLIGLKTCEKIGVTKEKIEETFICNDLVITEDLEIISKSKDLMKQIAKAESIEKIWEIVCKSILNLEVASGVAVYERNLELNEIQCKRREGIEGMSRFKGKWAPHYGEKALILYIHDLLAEAYDRTRSTTKYLFKNMLNVLKCWHIKNREELPEFGLTKKILKKSLEECGIDKINTGIFKIIGKSRKLVQSMIEMQKKRLAFTDQLIDKRMDKVYTRFIKENKITNQKEKENLDKIYQKTVVAIKENAKNAIKKTYYNHERINTSRSILSQQGIKDLYKMITEEVFENIVHHFSEALNDIELDKLRLEIKEKGTPERLRENLYYVISDANYRPIALVLANNHGLINDKGRTRSIFEGQKEDLLVGTLSEISDTLSLALQLRKRDVIVMFNKEQAEKLYMLSNIINDESIEIAERLVDASDILRKLFRKESESINSSIMKVVLKDSGESDDKSESDEMEIVAATKFDKDKKSKNKIKISGIPDKISVWVAQNKIDMFVSNGKVYKGVEDKEGNIDWVEISKNEFNEIENKYPILYAQLQGIMSDPKNTFMSVPLLAGDELLGVVNVDGARLNEGDMKILKSAAITLSLAIKSKMQTEKLDKLYKKAQVSSFTDQLTKIFNRKYFDLKIPVIFADAQIKNKNLSFLMVDMDGLKPFDDSDHLAGDHILESIAGFMTEFINKKKQEAPKKFIDVVLVRYGGDEFSFILPGFKSEEAVQFASELKEYVSSQKVVLERGEFKGEHNFTLTIGVAELKSNMGDYTDLIRSADEAMFWKKRNGKDGVCLWSSDVSKQATEIRNREKNEKVRIQKNERERNEACNKLKNLLADIEKDLEDKKVDEAVDLIHQAVNVFSFIEEKIVK